MTIDEWNQVQRKLQEHERILRDQTESRPCTFRKVASNDYAFTLVNLLTGKGACWGDVGFGGNCTSVDFSKRAAGAPGVSHTRGLGV